MKAINEVWFFVFTMPLMIAGMVAGFFISSVVVTIVRPVALGIIVGWKEGQKPDDDEDQS